MAINTYIIGQTIVLRCAFTVDGALTDPTAALCEVEAPDGTIATPAVAAVSTGVRTAQYTPTQAGMHAVAWSGTGAAAGYNESQFYVVARKVD